MPEKTPASRDSGDSALESGEVSRPDTARATKVEMARRLRESPAFRALFSVLKGIPDVFSEIRSVLDRKEEFVRGAQKEGRSNRALTGLFAGINLSERGGALLDEAIQRKVEADREYLVEQIRQGKNYSPELVIGTGPESVVYNSERFALLPNDPALTVEKERKIAGLWGLIFNAVWGLNSRTRPKNVDLPNLPGTEGSLNDLGEAVLQQSDIEGMAYGEQDKLRKAIETDHAVMSVVANEIEVVKVRRNLTKARGRYEVDLFDRANGGIIKFYTDRVVAVTGLGKEISGLDESDPETMNILEEERLIALEGGNAKVLTLPEFVAKMGAKEDPFPIHGWEKVIATGPNDSGRIAAGIVLGYETSLGKTVAQLDRVKELTWIGQTASTKEEFARLERLRYAQLGLEFPRESDPDYYHRINPKPGRAIRLSREGKNIRVVYQMYEIGSDGRVVIDEDTGQKKFKIGSDGRPVEESVVGDHVVLNNGFLDRTDAIFAPLNNKIYRRREDISIDYYRGLATPGSVFYMKDGRSIEITSLDNDNQTIEFSERSIGEDGKPRVVTGGISLFDDKTLIPSRDDIEILEIGNGGILERELVYAGGSQEEITTSDQGYDFLTELEDADRLIEAVTTVGTVFVYRKPPAATASRAIAQLEITRIEGQGKYRVIEYETKRGDGVVLDVGSFDVGPGIRPPYFLVNGLTFPVPLEVKIPKLPDPDSQEQDQGLASERGIVRVTDPAEIKRRLKTIALVPGATVYFSAGPVANIGVTQVSSDGPRTTSVLRLALSIRNLPETAVITLPSLGESTPEKFSQSFMKQLFLYGLLPEDLGTAYLITVPDSPIAAKYKDEEVYLAGPSGKLPLTPAEINRAPVLGSIKENVAAIFRYSSYVAALSRALARRDLKRAEVPPNVAAARPKPEMVELPEFAISPGSETSLVLDFEPREMKRALPSNFSFADFIKLAAGEKFYQYLFPENLKEIVLEVRPLSEEEKRDTELEPLIALRVKAKPALPEEYIKPLYAFLRDEVVEKILLKYADRSLVASGQVEIVIPMLDRKVDAAGVVLRSPRVGRRMARQGTAA